MSAAVVMALASGLVGMGGILDTALNFDPRDPWYGVGLLATGAAVACAIGAVLLSHRSRILAAFDVGRKVGYREGRKRSSLAVVERRQRSREHLLDRP